MDNWTWQPRCHPMPTTTRRPASANELGKLASHAAKGNENATSSYLAACAQLMDTSASMDPMTGLLHGMLRIP
jgi:hypothetical protein